MSFVIVCLCSFVEMLRSQLLEETPRIVLLCTLFFLVGWMSWNGLEDMARFAVLCTVVTVLLLVLVVVSPSAAKTGAGTLLQTSASASRILSSSSS